jgi:basic amino acid/polyamine antiporter, APA family
MPNQPNASAKFSLTDATLIVAGSMIGSGIFIVSSDIMRHVGSSGWLIMVWVITGVMTLTAALSYGELSAMFPKAGGQYVYLKEAYNPLVGFLYGWSFFAVIQTATIAAVGVAFAKFMGYIVPQIGINPEHVVINILGLPLHTGQLVSIIVITLLTLVNVGGVKEGKWIQRIFTAAKLLALFGLIILGFLLIKNGLLATNLTDAFNATQVPTTPDGKFINNSPTPWPSIGISALVGAIAIAMTGSVFSSDAWNNVTFIAGEVKNPQRNIGLSLLLGTLIVTIIYVSINFMYLNVLTPYEIAFASNDRVAIAAAEKIWPAQGSVIIAVLIMISTFGCNNGLILAGARVYQTMAKDNLFLPKAKYNNKAGVPEFALVLQCLVACAWSISGKYNELLAMISLVVVAFYILTIVGIFILRKKQPNAARPYKAFGYPVLPALYIILGLAFCILLIIWRPSMVWPGMIVTAIGLPIYYLLKNKLTPH